MNDDFLNQQQPPRRAFADALAKRLKAIEQENTMIASNGHKKILEDEGAEKTEMHGGKQSVDPTLNPSPLRKLRGEGLPERARNGSNSVSPSQRQWRGVRLIALIAACIGIVIALAVGFAPQSSHEASLVQIESSLLPPDLQRITPENIDRLEVVATLGEGILTSADWSPDGETIAAGGARGVWLMDAEDPTRRELLTGSDAGISSVAYSPDGETLAAVGYSGEIYLYDMESRVQTMTFSAPPGGYAIDQMVWIDAERLAVVLARTGMTSQGMNFQYYAWQIHTTSGEWARLVADELLIGGRIAITPNGRWLAYWLGSEDGGRLMLLDLLNGERDELATYTNGVQAITFSHDGTMLYAAHEFGIDRWNVMTGEQLEMLPNEGRYDGARYITTSPDDQSLTLADMNTAIIIYDLETGDIHRTDPGLVSPFAVALYFSPDGSEYVYVMSNGLYFNSIDGNEPREYITQNNNGVVALALDDAGQTLAALEWGDEQPPRLWDLATGDDRLLEFERYPSDFYAAGITTADLNGDGTRLLTATAQYTTLIDTTTGEVLWLHRTQDSIGAYFARAGLTNADSDLVVFDEGTNEVFRYDLALAASFNPLSLNEQLQVGAVGGEYVAIGVYNGVERTGGVIIREVRDLGVAGAEATAVQTVGDREIDALAFSADGRWLATATSDLGERGPQVVNLTLWNWETGQTMGIPNQNAAPALSDLAVSADGKLVYALSNVERMLQAWDMENSSVAATLDDGTRGWSLTSLALSRDERLLITGGYDGLIRVWGVRE
jgi:WD40 repeat protein